MRVPILLGSSILKMYYGSRSRMKRGEYRTKSCSHTRKQGLSYSEAETVLQRRSKSTVCGMF